jgi:hypothetical protein
MEALLWKEPLVRRRPEGRMNFRTGLDEMGKREFCPSARIEVQIENLIQARDIQQMLTSSFLIVFISSPTCFGFQVPSSGVTVSSGVAICSIPQQMATPDEQ